jgi:hypothetical protein
VLERAWVSRIEKLFTTVTKDAFPVINLYYYDLFNYIKLFNDSYMMKLLMNFDFNDKNAADYRLYYELLKTDKLKDILVFI